jgi:hypothetical protein
MIDMSGDKIPNCKCPHENEFIKYVINQIKLDLYSTFLAINAFQGVQSHVLKGIWHILPLGRSL